MIITEKCMKCDCLDSNANGLYCQLLFEKCEKQSVNDAHINDQHQLNKIDNNLLNRIK